MKKLFIVLFSISIAFVYFGTVLAAFPEGQLGDTIDIEADFSSQGSVYFEFNLKNISDNQPTETINWDSSLVSFGIQKPQWLWSTTYAVVTATITKNANYYMYQVNTTTSSLYVAEKARTVNVYYEPGYNKDNDPEGLHIASTTYAYNGLVNKDTKGGEYKGFIALSFMFSDSKLPSSSSEFKNPYDPEVMLENKVSRYFTDEKDFVRYKDGHEDSNFKKEYSQVAGAGGPVFGVYNESGEYAPWRPTLVDNTAYMYFGGNFMNISPGDIFGTDQIVIEKYVE